ncbi:50S ribosomal protein L19e [Candidatus Micrarchaeota archaeon]|nr:50S ribosomal protein L19e [Candidatus Micrarchaeota archaeon]
MGLVTIKRLAADLMKCGESRVRILDAKKAEEALTREDVRRLVKERVIIKLQAIGVGRSKAQRKHERKREGRRRGPGSKKGTPFAAKSRKRRWIEKTRAQRKLLKSMKQKMDNSAYRKTYRMVKGSAFRTKKQLAIYLEEKGSSKGEAQ